MADLSDSPSLQEQTNALGETLKEISESDPLAAPSALSVRVFAEWLTLAGPASREPGLFADVSDNYVPADNTNRDLFHLFTMLQSYIDAPDEDDEPASPKTFINLPLLLPSFDAPSGKGGP